jgi:hypothetical protein
VNDEPMQKIIEYTPAKFQISHISINEQEALAGSIQSIIEKEAGRVFDFENGPLFKAQLLSCNDRSLALIFTLHHIIFDEQSAAVLKNEFHLLYQAYCHGLQSPLPPLTIQYRDYAAWQHNRFKNDGFQQDRDYWLSRLSGELPVLQIEKTYRRHTANTDKAAVLRFMLTEEGKGAFDAVVRSNDTTMFVALLAIVKVLLYRISGQTDIIVGTTVSNRNHEELENQIGFYVNMLALRTIFDADDDFNTLLSKVKDTVLGAYDHQEYPFDLLVKDLNVKHDANSFPVSGILVEMITKHDADSNTITGDMIHELLHRTQYDLSFRFMNTTSGIVVHLEYNTDLFNRQSIMNISKWFRHIMITLGAAPGTPLRNVRLPGHTGNIDEKEQKLKQIFDESELF